MTRDCLGREDNIKIDLKIIIGVLWTGLMWPEIETSSGCCEHGHEHLD
jgi:hypothetical protein